MSSTEPDLLSVVERSPAAAAAHDRAAWTGLFTTDGRVEDPVGSRPHVGPGQIGRFYDTFIHPRDITFHRGLDVVRGSTVIRELRLEVAMGPTVTMQIPAILRYDLRAVRGEWKLARLRAYWELPAMMRQFLCSGVGALPAGWQLAKSLLRNQGPAGTAGFTAGFRRPGARRKNLVRGFVTALAAQDVPTALHALSPGAALTFGDDTAADATELAARLAGVRPNKLLGAGTTVAISVDSEHRRGVLFADLAPRGTAIDRVRYFPAT